MARSLELYRVCHLIGAVMMLLGHNTGMSGADEDSTLDGVEI
jgi:hypothetical protein